VWFIWLKGTTKKADSESLVSRWVAAWVDKKYPARQKYSIFVPSQINKIF